MNVKDRSNALSSLFAVILLVSYANTAVAEEKRAVIKKANLVHETSSTKDSQRVLNDSSKSKKRLVDINKASKAELMSLPTIGEVEANRIIAGRPYKSKADITTHGQLPGGVYQIIKAQIVVQ